MLVNSEWCLLDGGFLLVGEKAAQAMLAFRQLDPRSAEAGGVLLGYRRDPHIEVIAVTTPGKNDVRRRTFFERRDSSHHETAREYWKQDRCIHYLGEWHTHPEPTPRPSDLDRSEWRRNALACRDPLVMLIVGQEGVWVGQQQQGKGCAQLPRYLVNAVSEQ